jgi:tetratricopeptide (TPR) repeat protein
LDSADPIEEYDKALSIYVRVLALEKDPVFRASIYRKVGDLYVEISKHRDRKENCKKAVDAYRSALEIYDKEHFPTQWAEILLDLEFIHYILSEMEDRAFNCSEAVKALKEASNVYPKDIYPHQYADLKLELCRIYRRLADVEDKALNAQKAVEACQRAIDIYYKDLKKNFASWAAAQKNLEYTYVNLSRIEEGAANRRKALEAYQRALKVYTLEKEPFHHAEIMRDLGYTHLALSEIGGDRGELQEGRKGFQGIL